MPEYKSERREKKRFNARKMNVSGRSVFLLFELSARPQKWKRPQLDKREKIEEWPNEDDPNTQGEY